MRQKPFELMRLYFGEKDECCGTCCNLREFRYNSKDQLGRGHGDGEIGGAERWQLK